MGYRWGDTQRKGISDDRGRILSRRVVICLDCLEGRGDKAYRGDPSSDPISESRVGVRLTASVSENIDRPAGPHVQVELKRVVLGAGAEPPAEQGRYEPGAKTPHRKRKTSQPRKMIC